MGMRHITPAINKVLSAKEICKYPSFSKVGGNYPLDLKIIWSSGP
jgi:hypothetical protein